MELWHPGDLGIDLLNLLLVDVGRGVNHRALGVGAALLAPVALGRAAQDSGHVDAARSTQQQILKKRFIGSGLWTIEFCKSVGFYGKLNCFMRLQMFWPITASLIALVGSAKLERYGCKFRCRATF